MSRLVPLPSDPSCWVDLDGIVSLKTTHDGQSGTVVFPSSAGEGTLALSIAQRWRLVLQVASGSAFEWESYDAPEAARTELTRLAHWVWRRKTGVKP